MSVTDSLYAPVRALSAAQRVRKLRRAITAAKA
jgi:hypothetical protein